MTAIDEGSIKARVKAYLMDNMLMTGGDASIADDTSFLREQVIDSTGVLELVEFLETSFGLKVADEDMVPENLDSLNAIGRYVRGKLAS